MKNLKLYLTSVLIGSSALVYADEINDTVKVIDPAQKVVVTRDSTSTKVDVDYLNRAGNLKRWDYKISVIPTDKDSIEFEIDDFGWPGFRTGNKNKVKSVLKRKYVEMRHIYVGWRMNYDADVKDCFELGIRNIAGIIWRRGKHEFESGIGFGFRRFLANDGSMFCKTDDSLSSMPMKDVKKSRLDIWSLQFPLFYNYKINRNTYFSIGGTINLNTYAKANSLYKDGESKVKEKYNGLTQNFLTADIVTSFNISGVGLYAGWSPFSIFKKEFGPAAKGYSIGLNFTID